MDTRTDLDQLHAVASRLREMREIMGWTAEEMAEKTKASFVKTKAMIASFRNIELNEDSMCFDVWAN